MTTINKYHIVYSIDLALGVRIIDIYDFCMLKAISELKDRVAAENDIPTKQVEIISAKMVKMG